MSVLSLRGIVGKRERITSEFPCSFVGARFFGSANIAQLAPFKVRIFW